MVDDRPEDTGPLPDPDRPKRAPPTIDLEATEVSSEHRRTGAGEPEPEQAPGRRSRVRSEPSPPAAPEPCEPVSQPVSPWAIAPISGAVAAALVIGVGWLLGWPGADGVAGRAAGQCGRGRRSRRARRQRRSPRRASPPRLRRSRGGGADRRAGKIGRRAAQRTRRHARAIGKAGGCDQRGESRAARWRTRRHPICPAINERIAQIERATRAQAAEIAQQSSELAAKLPRRSRPTMCRCAASWRRPCSTSRSGHGDPYAAALAAAKAAGGQSRCAEAAGGFAASGVPSAGALSRELLDARAETVAAGARYRHHRHRHRRSPAGRRRKAGAHRAHRRRRQRSRQRRRARHRGGAAQRCQRGAARIEDAGARRSRRRASLARQGRCPRCRARGIPSIRGRRHGGARQTGAIGISMYPDHSVSGVDRARGGGRGLGCRSDRRRRAVLGRLARRDLAAGVRAGARRRHRRGGAWCGRSARAVAHAGADPARPARAASRPRPARHHARAARDRPRRFHRRPRACRCRAAPCRGRSAGAAAARAIGPARWRPRRRAARVPRHGRARGYAAAGPARTVHRSAARRRSGRRGDDRRRGAEACAGIDLGVACGARISLRQGRLDRRAGDPRQQSRLRA